VGAAAVTVARSKGELPANVRQARAARSALGIKKSLAKPGQALKPITNQTNMKNYIIETGMSPFCSISNQ
jgi:hypothetical protein